MTKFVISGYIGFDNFGDEIIAKVLISHLKNIGAEKITVLSSNPYKTSKLYSVDSVSFLKFFEPIFKSDVLISGGGSLLQDITSLKSLIYYLAVIVTALILNKKVIIFAQGFTPFRTKFGKIFTKIILSYCNLIYVRDIESQKLLEEMNIKSTVIADPAFGAEISICKEKIGLGVQLRSFQNLSKDFLDKLADNIALNFKNEEIKLFSLQDELDLCVLEKFSKLLEKKGCRTKIYYKMSIEDILREFAQIEYLIGMRFHSLLIAAKSGVKVLGINYDVKVENLSKKIGFSTINLFQKDINKEVENLKNVDVKRYNIPDFKFPEI